MVMVTSSKPRSLSHPMNMTTPRLTSGSPPVTRTLVTPSSRQASAKVSISSRVRMWLLSWNWMSSGMQYWQRKLQRSVTEILR